MDSYIYQADLHCEDCGETLKSDLSEYKQSEDSDCFPQGPYPNGGGEADTPQHCGTCGLFLENPLTDEGQAYVDQAVRDYQLLGKGNKEILVQWAEFYGTYSANVQDWK